MDQVIYIRIRIKDAVHHLLRIAGSIRQRLEAFQWRTLGRMRAIMMVVMMMMAAKRWSSTPTRRAVRQAVQVVAIIFAEFQKAARTLRVRRVFAVRLAGVLILQLQTT